MKYILEIRFETSNRKEFEDFVLDEFWNKLDVYRNIEVKNWM